MLVVCERASVGARDREGYGVIKKQLAGPLCGGAHYCQPRRRGVESPLSSHRESFVNYVFIVVCFVLLILLTVYTRRAADRVHPKVSSGPEFNRPFPNTTIGRGFYYIIIFKKHLI